VVTVQTERLGDEVVLSVVDCGPGIPLEIRPEIFSLFFTTKKEGTGLGLPIASKIIDAHGGRIEADDNVEKGMTFKVTLPVGRS
jgi:signal transduction histidine kinase